MSSYLASRLSSLHKSAGVAPPRESYVDQQDPGPGNWFERNLPFMEPSIGDKAKYYGERGLRHVGDAGRYLTPSSGAEAASLAATGAATGMFGDTAKALSPIGAAAPLLEYYYGNRDDGMSLRDPALQRAAVFAALPLVGKLAGDVFAGRRRATPQLPVYYR